VHPLGGLPRGVLNWARRHTLSVSEARFCDRGRFVGRPGVGPTTGSYGWMNGVSAASCGGAESTSGGVTGRVITSLGATTTDAVEAMTP
jgi:hypothetical protein